MMNQGTVTDTSTTCCIICVVVVFVFLIILIIFSIIPLSQVQYKCDEFTDLVVFNGETLANKVQGGKNYHAVSPKEDIKELIEEKKDSNGNFSFIAILADWCGFCQKLKQSKALTKLSKDYNVFVLTDAHPQATPLMQLVESEGFPTLIIADHEKNKLYKYENGREYILMKQTMDKMHKMDRLSNPSKYKNNKMKKKNKKRN